MTKGRFRFPHHWRPVVNAVPGFREFAGMLEGNNRALEEYLEFAPRLLDEPTVLATTTSSITIPIPQTHDNLRFLCLVRDDSGATVNTLFLRCNGDTGANYDHERIEGVGNVAGAAAAVAQTSMAVGYVMGNGSAAGAAAINDIRIPNYRGRTFHKQVISTAGATAGVAGVQFAATQSGRWRSINAITSVTFFSNGGNLVAGSCIYPYGE